MKGKPWLVVPYALDRNDGKYWRGAWSNGDQFFSYLKDSFDMLYKEGATHPKMLSIGLHSRVSGRPGRAMAVARFIEYAKGFPRVWFAGRDEIAAGGWSAPRPGEKTHEAHEANQGKGNEGCESCSSPQENPMAKERYAKIQAQLDGYASAGTQVELCFPDDYPGAKLSSNLVPNEVPGIYRMLQTPAIIRKMVWAEHNGYDAVVQSNTFDPGVEAASQTVHIPVIGVFRTALHTASVLSNSIAIIAPLEEHIATHGKLFTPTACRLCQKYYGNRPLRRKR